MIRHTRINLSLHTNVITKINSRIYGTSASAVVDKDLTRLYSLVDSVKERVKSQASAQTWTKLTQAFFANFPENRNTPIQMLRTCFPQLYKENKIGEEEAAFINQLNDVEFLAALDILEALRYEIHKRGQKP